MMMALNEQSEKQGEFRLGESPDEMENLVLDDVPNGRLSAVSHHPLSQPSDDEILSPSSPFPNTNSSANTFLEPPSYADAIFTSFDESKRLESPHASSSSISDSHYLSISVEDPQKEQEFSNSLVQGTNTYFSYLITTKTNMPEFKGQHFSVRRRFKDVVTLSDRLSETYRGFFIPPRPDKNVVESQMMQEQEFVDQRRVALEKYLKKLAHHPAIRKSDELRVFLQVQGKLPLPRNTDVASRIFDGAAKLPKQLFAEVPPTVDLHAVVQPAKGGRDLLRIFKELKQSVSNDWSGGKPFTAEDDRDFLEKKNLLQVIESQLNNVSQQAESLVKAQQDIGETSGELGLAFVKLTKFETDEAVYNSQRVRAADMKNVATAAVKASRLWRELNAQTVKHLDKLHDHLGMMLAVNTAFSDRASALLTVQTLVSELASLHSRIDKLEAASSKIFGGDRSRIQKIEALKETIKVTEDAKCCAVTEYERIKENNRNEMERLDKERRTDFVSMLKGFVFNQVGYAQKMVDVWNKVADETHYYANASK